MNTLLGKEGERERERERKRKKERIAKGFIIIGSCSIENRDICYMLCICYSTGRSDIRDIFHEL